MRMSVDKSGNQSATLQVLLAGAAAGKRIPVIAEGNDSAASDQDVTNSEVFRREDSGVCEQF